MSAAPSADASGFVRDRALFYSTAGLAWAAVKGGLQYQDAVQQALAGADALSYSQIRYLFGLALGNGIEWAVRDHLSVKAEYLFIYLTKEQFFGGTTEAALTGFHAHTFRLGLNWLLH
jgi:opacity protein-like surface antigen